MTTDAEGRSALVAAASRLFAAGVISASGHGNLSARLDGERMLLTAGGTIDGLGPDVSAAAMLVVALEEGAQAEWRAAALGGAVPLPAGALEAVRAAMAAARGGR